jgi:topoisomerase-4 subunit A
MLVFPQAEMKVQSGGRGVIILALDADERLAAIAVPPDDATLSIEGTGRGNKPIVITLSPRQREGLRHRRARRGATLTPKIKPERMG